MTKRIFRATCAVALVVLLSTLALTLGFLRSSFTRVQLGQLKTQTALAAALLSRWDMDFAVLEAENCRVTWVGTDGTVLYDSHAQAPENHLQRQEIQAAMETGFGESVRYSATLQSTQLYSALRLEDGTVLRLSTAQPAPLSMVLAMLQPLLMVVGVVLILALVLAAGLSRRIVRPLNGLDLNDPLSFREYGELEPLLRRMDFQQRQLKAQAVELKRKQREFDTVTSSMSEGLLLLGNGGTILTMNHAAAKVLGLSRNYIGMNFFTLNRVEAVEALIHRAKEGSACEERLHLNGGDYQIDASPVHTEGGISGVAVLLFDVTQKQKAELLRREFTANVSHELKTPLHAISGFAELMKSGMVPPKDMVDFSGKIYTEAQRLMGLVEDILRLSRLDAGAEDMSWEDTDLYALAAEAVQNAAALAQSRQVTLALGGSPALVHGIRQLLSGILSNLINNAIKYNRPGGHVDIFVRNDPEAIILMVADTGIGIPAEHQSRVFERFYRVDKSHSKAVGGTGLGLSIVKHAALIHNAEIDLASTPGEGTTITLRFLRNSEKTGEIQ